ncbi:hypothetical protein H5410_057599 [Solanum commersonii]|uniref:Uncharacterized protein n=1 Tax=Solanum commersonii TaxID=4109 RepID=A0A9J5WNJ1_SOLCO|nr:hypothetical protein H5410_057599 [Solanum commersonii]
MPEHTSDLLSCWIRRGGCKTQKRWWKLIPSCIWWSVWRERNGRCFEDKSNSIHKVKWNCLVSLLFWCKQLCIDDEDQITELIGSLFIIRELWVPNNFGIRAFMVSTRMEGRIEGLEKTMDEVQHEIGSRCVITWGDLDLDAKRWRDEILQHMKGKS